MFISADELLRDSYDLAVQVVRSGFEPTFLVGIWRGGAPIGISVQEVLEYNGIESDHISIRTSSYTGIDQQAPSVRVHAIDYLVSRLTYDDRLLLIDDVFDSGRSVEAVIDELTPPVQAQPAGADPDRDRLFQAHAQSKLDRSRLLRPFDRPMARLSARARRVDARGNLGAPPRRRELL